ncbi:MAG: hypothetical protein P4L83_00520 [Nevskia sp.]|nr:hypothetical protein [Nevskia sp.]
MSSTETAIQDGIVKAGQFLTDEAKAFLQAERGRLKTHFWVAAAAFAGAGFVLGQFVRL